MSATPTRPKGGGTGKAAKRPESENRPATSGEVFLLQSQVQSLEERLSSEEETKLSLARRASALRQQLAQRKQSRDDMATYLMGEVRKKGCEMAQASAKVQELQAERALFCETSEKQVQALNKEWEVQLTTLRLEINTLKAELARMEEYRAREPLLMAEVTTLKKDLHNERHDHQKDVADLERKRAMDFERVRRDYEGGLTQLRAEYEGHVRERFMREFREATSENESLKRELRIHSSNTRNIRSENKRLTKENAALQREVDLLRQANDDLTKKVVGLHRLLKREKNASVPTLTLAHPEEKTETRQQLLPHLPPPTTKGDKPITPRGDNTTSLWERLSQHKTPRGNLWKQEGMGVSGQATLTPGRIIPPPPSLRTAMRLSGPP